MNLEKFEAINNRMNRITEELHKNINLSDEMLTTTEEMADIFNTQNSFNQVERIQPIVPISNGIPQYPHNGNIQNGVVELQNVNELAASVVDANAMVEDFCFVRERLKETTENNRRVLDSITEELIHADGESRVALVMAYSELNKAQLDGMRLFMQSYKEVSVILVNLAKVQSSGGPKNQYTTNVLNIEGSSDNVNVADIVKRIRKAEKAEKEEKESQESQESQDGEI